jgi:tRNA acetyltransferase TAN1
MIYEILYLLKETLGDQTAEASKTGVRGLIAARTALNPAETIEKFKTIIHERPYEFRYAQRIIPVEKVVETNLESMGLAAAELAGSMGENESFRVTVEKRFTTLHTQEIIEAVAAQIKNPVNLDNPDRVLLVEIVGKYTGLSLVKPEVILSVPKEKML